MWWRTIVAQANARGEVYHQPLPIPISATLNKIMRDLAQHGMRALVVGGAVRDAMQGIAPKDIDVEIYGTDYDQLVKILSPYGRTDVVGKSFGVIKFTDPQGFDYDFSVPRRDSKVEDDPSRQGFNVKFDPTMTPRDAAARRDFTWNAMAFDPMTQEVHDYFGGKKDLDNGIIRHTSPAFAEDPLRVLRGMQFAARFGFNLAPETAELSRALAQEVITSNQQVGSKKHADDEPHPIEAKGLMTWDGKPFYDPLNHHHMLTRRVDGGRTLSKERLEGEFGKLMAKGKYPSKALKYLQQTGWIQFFPEIANMDQVPQDPEWHPEGDVLTHTGHVLDAAAKIAEREGLEGDDRAAVMYSALLHDPAKSHTTALMDKGGKQRWTAHGHEEAGGPLAEAFLRRIGVKPDIIVKVRRLVENHLAHINFDDPSVHPRVIRRLAKRIHPASIKDLTHLIEADHSGRPPLPAGLPKAAQRMRQMAEEQQVHLKPQSPMVLGRHVLPYFNNKPGKHIGEITQAASAAQENAEFSQPQEAFGWLKNHMAERGVVLPPDQEEQLGQMFQ